jgi:phenylpropionate dioxygenase-like ring-hydroxylating dioxygenase large terminal subunit
MSGNVAVQACSQIRQNMFHPVLRADQLRDKPVRVTIAGEHYALFRTADGTPAAVRDRCPHRFAPLSAGTVRADGRLACPYHGWHFDAQGNGASPSQPNVKHCHVAALRVEEVDSYLWLSAKNTEAKLPSTRPVDPGYEFAGTFALELDAALEHALDIFSDAEHPAWVHGRLAWGEQEVDQIRYEHSIGEDYSIVKTSGPQRQSWVSRVLGLRPGDRFNNHWVTRFDPVRVDFFMFWTDPVTEVRRPLSLRIALFLVPASERKTNLHAFVYTSLDHPASKLLLPIVKRLAVYAGRHEAREDQTFLRNMSDAPTSPKGMRLGWLDRAIAHNRKLLSRVYYGDGDASRTEQPPGPEKKRKRPLELVTEGAAARARSKRQSGNP